MTDPESFEVKKHGAYLTMSDELLRELTKPQGPCPKRTKLDRLLGWIENKRYIIGVAVGSWIAGIPLSDYWEV